MFTRVGPGYALGILLLGALLIGNLVTWSIERDYSHNACYQATFIDCMGKRIARVAGLAKHLW